MTSDLGKRLWEQFEEICRKQPKNRILFQLRITPEEVAALQSVAHAFGGFYYDPVREDIIKYWKYDGLIYILLFTFAKYVHKKEERFWVGWEKWAKPDSTSDLLNPKNYQYIKSFSDNHDLFLYCPNRNEYVSSLRTHAFLGQWSLDHILRAFVIVLLKYLYRLDNADRDYLLKEVLDQISENPTENIEDDEDTEQLPFHFRKSFRMAAFLQNALVFDQLQELFRLIHESVIRSANQTFTEITIPDHVEPYIQEIVAGILQEPVSSKYSTIIRENYTGSDGIRHRFRRPGIILDPESMMLKLFIPEQRVFNREAGFRFKVLIAIGSEEFETPLSFRYFSNQPFCTREQELDILAYHGSVSWKICRNGITIKENHVEEKVLYFDTEGNGIQLPLTEAQDVFILVSDDCSFECDDASPFDLENVKYKVFFTTCNENTLFLVDNVFISPFAKKVPNFVEKHKDSVYQSVSIISADNAIYSVYKVFPEFAIRAKDEKTLRSSYPLYLDDIKIEYTILKKSSLYDGSDEYVFDIAIPASYHVSQSVSRFDLEIGAPVKLKKTLFIIKNLEFSFSDPLYFSRDEVRVQALFFESCETFFSGSYSFPMKDNNTRYRIMLDNEEYRLGLIPPIIHVTLDNLPVPEISWWEDIYDKKMHIATDLSSLRVFVRFSNKTERMLSPVLINGQREYALSGLSRANIPCDDPVDMVVDINGKQKLITTIYYKFAFLEDPRFLCSDQCNTSSPLINKEGFFMFAKMMGSKRKKYEGVLTYLTTGQDYKFDLPISEHGLESVFITDQFVVNGRSKLTVQSKSAVFGKKEKIEAVEYERIFDSLYEENQREAQDVVKITTESILEVESSSGTCIYNFFLEIDDDLFGAEGFLANGFFIAKNGSKIYHTFFNPYTITDIIFYGNEISCTIKDKNGKCPGVDKYGRVNPIRPATTGMQRIQSIYAKVLPNVEEKTYDF